MGLASKVFRSRTGCVALAVATTMSFAACSSSSSSTSAGGSGSGSSTSAAPPPPAAPSTVSITATIPTAPFAAIYAARGTTGAFAAVEKKFHTKIKFTTIPNPADATGAMVSGSVDVSFGGLQNYLIAQAAGKNVVAAFTNAVGAPGVMIAAKKYESTRGTDLAKFGGASVGYTKEGSGSEFNMKLAFGDAGVSWGKLKHIAFGSPAAALPLLQAGRLDVASVDPTSAVQAITTGSAYLLVNYSASSSTTLSSQLGTVWAFNKSFTTKYSELTRAVVQAMVAGLNAVKKVAGDPAAVLAMFPDATKKALTAGWVASWALSKPGVVASDGTLTAEDVKSTLAFDESNQILTAAQAATAATVVDNQFAS